VLGRTRLRPSLRRAPAQAERCELAGSQRFGFSGRHTKVIGRFPGETSCLSLCWAVLDLVITHSNNVTFTDLEQLTLERLGRERTTPSTQRR
jgi:hypothetical protein